MESFVSLGRIHIPIFGLFAAAGVMSALALGLRTSRLARVNRDAFWNLCVVTVLSAFLLSRLLLVAENLQVFFHYPLAVLELPALSAGGVLLTIVVALGYMRRRGLPVIGVLEAGAPCAAVLACFYKVGEFAGGTREGMPTNVPWAVGSSFGRVHPFELYMAAGWLVVCLVLIGILRRGLPQGQSLGWAMILCGLVNTLTDFFHLPNVLYGTEMLDRIEWRGIELIVLGSLLLAWRMAVPKKSPVGVEEVHNAV